MARMSAYGTQWTEAQLQNNTVNVEGPHELRKLGLYEMSPLAYELLFDYKVSDKARLLVKYGADVNSTCLKTGKSILELCIERHDQCIPPHGMQEIILFLLDNGATRPKL